MTDNTPFTLAEVATWIRRATHRRAAPPDDGTDICCGPREGPPRCPRCGSYKWIYQGDRQVCADCGR